MRTTPPSTDLPNADPAWRIGIVYATYYKEEIAGLVDAATATLREAGVLEANVTLHPAPGSFEVPLIGRALADAKAVDALIGFGIIVQGETKHADLLATESARGIMDVQMRFGLPFAFEILHVHHLDQARERSVGPGSKGREAAYAVLHSLKELQRIRTM
ncbi:MAG: 6,7-dimethyl-8-ribityllumazine synthase [Candidatus Peregrinibacteria bacterium Gr01-1014_25]|nr:MAG: 6,7-dimethyl-8-ribityllumazine synthase [Candidatus Peregrinibacteria bacterium Gr01-1014_25]